MFSSAKFLSPIVTAGLPTPGPLVAAELVAVVLAVLAAELVLLDDELLLLPQAASPTPSAVTANAAEMLDMNVLDLLRRLRVIRRLPGLRTLLIGIIRKASCGRYCGRERRLLFGMRRPQSARSERALEQRQRAVHRQRQRCHADRRPQHSREVVAGF